MSNEFLDSITEFVIRLNCAGPTDVDAFNTAIANALEHQPLLQANATIGPTHSASYWRPATNLTPVIKWLNGDPAFSRAATDDFQPIELENEIGFRFYGWQFLSAGQPRTEMRFIFHHACCDGKGAIKFIEHVLCQYKLLKEGKCEAMPSLVGDRILVRDQYAPHSFGIADRVWRAFVVRPKRLANMLLTRPLSMDPTPETKAGKVAGVPHQCSATLDQEVTKQLGIFAQSVGATTNLVLARELFHVLGSYLESNIDETDGSRGGNLVRMLIPFSLRNETHRLMPAANCVSMAYLETKQDLLAQDDTGTHFLLPNLVNQMAFIRKWQLQYAWIESIKSYARLWPLIKRFKRSEKLSSRQVATTVMSNLGRVFSGEFLSNFEDRIKIDSLEIETVHLVLPCTLKLSVNFAVNFYCNRLTLDVSYLPTMIAGEAAQGLLDSWQSRILEVAKQQG